MGPNALAGIITANGERPPGMVMHGERTGYLNERAHAGKGTSREAVMEGVSAILLLQILQVLLWG